MESTVNNSSSPVMFRLDNASLDFGGGAGVFELNLSLSAGAILGMIGPSGCGKTTTVRLLNGIYASTSGEVRVFDKDPARSFNESDKTRIGYIPQQFILYSTLSAEENLHFMGGIYGMPPRERRARIKPLLEFIDMVDARNRLAGKLSGGMQRRLMLASALLHNPDFIIADEPTAGIDPILRARIWENFRSLRNQGKTLLVTTQYVGEAAYCDMVAVMRRGRLVTVDTPAGLRRQAMGGDVIHLQVEKSQVVMCQEFLEKLEQVSRVERVNNEEGGLFVYVENAGKELPTLLANLREQGEITPGKAEPYLPAFDEVFVRLINAADSQQSQEVVL
jgi:ABC-2 type transport system ATP-binding protein